MKFYYQGKEAQLVPEQQYSTHWNFYIYDEQGRKQIIAGQPGIDLFIREDNEPPPSNEEMEAELIAAEMIAAGETTTTQAININKASWTDIRKAFPGLARVTVKQISLNRPEKGYQSFEELVSLNKSKCPAHTQWDSIKKLILFE